MNKETTPPSPDGPPCASIPGKCPLHRPFDSAPLLQALMAEDGPMGVAESLDQAYSTLAEYLVSDPNTAGHRYAHILSDLRRVRNALIQGGGWHYL